MKCSHSTEIREQSIMKTEELVALQLFEKHCASKGCSVCIWKSASLPSRNEGNFWAFISNHVQLFDMEMVEVTVQLILKALSSSLSISLGRAREWKRWEIGAKTREKKVDSVCPCVYMWEKKREREPVRERVIERERETSFAKAVVSPMWWSHCNAPKLRGERVYE